MDSHSKKKVLITGANGFTGKHLAHTLKSLGYDVLELVYQKPNSLSQVQADLKDISALKRILELFQPESVIHLAAISFVGHDNNLDFYRVNVLGTQNLLDAICMVDIPRPRLIVASSANVYGALEKEKITEVDVCEPVNHYAISKLAMEKIVMTYFSEFDIVITRPFNYTGIYQADCFLVPKIVNHFRDRRSVIELGNIDVARDYSSIDYVVNVYCRLLESDVSSTIVNICSSRLISLEDILDMMVEISGNKIDVEINPKFVRKNEIYKISGDNSKLFSVVGNIPIKPFREVLTQMYHAN